MLQEEAASGAKIVEEEQLLLLCEIQHGSFYAKSQSYLANLAMIALCSFSKERLVLIELLLVGERDTVNPLE